MSMNSKFLDLQLGKGAVTSLHLATVQATGPSAVTVESISDTLSLMGLRIMCGLKEELVL